MVTEYLSAGMDTKYCYFQDTFIIFMKEKNSVEKHSRNNSLYLKYIVNKIAEIKGLSEEEVIKNTTDNAFKVYGINKES